MQEQQDAFGAWCRATLDDICGRWDETVSRQPYWSTAFAVGSPDWLEAIGGDNTDLTEYTRPAEDEASSDQGSHVLNVPQTVFPRLWEAFSKKRKR